MSAKSKFVNRDEMLARAVFKVSIFFAAAPVVSLSTCVDFAGGAQVGSVQRKPAVISLAANRERARPPAWSADVLAAFFPDVRSALAGERPNYGQSPAVAKVDRSGSVSTAATKWTELIDAETIETEIKRLATAVAADVTAAGPFKGGGFRASRRHFSQLAVLFGVTAQFDGPARWQDAAAGLRDAFARAGKNAKVGSDQTFQEAVARKQDLAELIRGARPQVSAGEKAAIWSDVADRPPLMQRFQTAQQERLAKWLASEAEFARQREEIRHEAQVVALLAHIVGRENFEFWDDAEYASFASELKSAAQELNQAAEVNNYNDARRTLDRANKACVNCHEGYRG